jgi:hypothetical protein
MSDEWVITLSYDLTASMEEMDRWAHQLEQFDGTVAQIPRRGVVDVTVHAPAYMDIWDAGRKMADELEHVVGVMPSAVEIITEQELYRRAAEPTLPELMSAAEIADELGISRQRVHQLRSTAGFPAPLADLRGGAVWDAAAIRKFAQTWERKPGRPRAEAAKTEIAEPTAPTPGDVAWRIENPSKQRFVLRNIGGDVAEHVEIDASRVEVIHRNLPKAAIVRPGEGTDMLLAATFGHPLPNQLYVRWAGQPDWVAVPLQPAWD